MNLDFYKEFMQLYEEELRRERRMMEREMEYKRVSDIESCLSMNLLEILETLRKYDIYKIGFATPLYVESENEGDFKAEIIVKDGIYTIKFTNI